jgi:hypothetical protein
MESIDQRREREELVGQVCDIIQLAADLQKKAASVMETIMLWNPPDEETQASQEPEQPNPNFVPLTPPPTPPQTCSVAVPAAGPVAITNDLSPVEKKVGTTRRNRILDKWESDARVTINDLASDMHMSMADISEILLRARKVRDPRVIQGDQIRAEQLENSQETAAAVAAAEVIIDKVIASPPPKPEPTYAKARNGVSLPKLNLPPLPEEKRKTPGWQPPVKQLNEFELIVLTDDRAIHGPKGFFRASDGVRDVMVRLSDSQMYAIDSLIKIGKWKTLSEAETAIRGLKPLLADCGLDLQIKAGLVKLNRQQENA